MAGKLWFQEARRRLLGRTNTGSDGVERPIPAAKDVATTAPAPQDTNHPPNRDATREELESTTDEQLSSLFFTRLPPELRCMIYAQVWSDAAGNGRMHLDSGGSADAPLRHVPCIVGHVQLGGVNATGAQHPEQGMLWWTQNQLLAVHWAAHAECAMASRLRPIRDTIALDPQLEEEQPGQGSFMPLFLTCKRVYSESITTLFETTTLIFQSSLDATKFFTPPQDRLPNRYFPTLRSIEINLAYEYDHVYLHSIANPEGHPRLPGADGVMVGMAAWDRLVRTLAAAAPELGGLEVFVGGMPPTGKLAFADTFDSVGWKPDRLSLQFPTDLQR
ncbi:hypothetical protein MGG_09329 [Pyricularia oryzae 70-15]|uniref:DUF7730 domain-containing protein n=3 Tax=Pyricularia oryzae TaxID=318829 RepID=G4NI73_PYRO7|nr:uncharacterized protein MGG_09329 [Pyricularia oryzae 70-15]EHA47933.1 hypothetical protein MGG_09329 [Pyricularia oryzae 70-15]ELQ34351.1 hypothetical protein OOU_Y34scaffold00770g11 [Pyricularia oryzae Y34]KAI7913442.1 hypothetical protein M9X92_009456 [Pyricularia oryzae]KAI7914362.1 hypothetical protein M0657_009528 [Pyricularia oryzae]